jgi:choline dehydrogenase-like flavoprotein
MGIMATNYDIIIIGTGPGGGTLAYALAATGKEILLLERGEYIPREKANWSPEAVYMEGLYRTSERWLDSQGKEFQPNLYPSVGGSTKVYGAALFRMRRADFEEMSHYEGISPAWELNYDDFEPYYYEAEKLYKVHGQRGEDPTESDAKNEFPFKPLVHEPRIQQVADSLAKQGLHPFSLPMGIDRDESNQQRSPCIRCDTCDGYPCLVDAKADAQTCGVDLALEFSNVTLITGANVDKLVTNTTGNQVTAVETTVNGEKQTFTADLIVVACGAINSAALLLKSANESHPQGLANSSGMVGRNLMKHNVSKLYALSQTPNPTIFQKTLAVNDFYFGSPEDNYPLGHVHLMGKHKWEMMRADFPKFVPNSLLKIMARHSVDWWVQSEDLPDVNNRVEIDSQGKIQVYYKANNTKAHQRLQAKFKQVLYQAGFLLALAVPMPLKIMNHQVGTCKFGSNPETDVLDLNCRTHDVDNLYVVDSSFFPSISAINPTLTIVANALRVAEHLKQRLQVDSGNLSLVDR